VFNLPCAKRRQPLTRVAKHRYRNPIILAQEWQEALTEGRYTCPADLARHIGVSRARVTQILRLLKLCPEVLNAMATLGDPLPSPIVTERSLRPLVELSQEEQSQWLTILMRGGWVDILSHRGNL